MTSSGREHMSSTAGPVIDYMLHLITGTQHLLLDPVTCYFSSKGATSHWLLLPQHQDLLIQLELFVGNETIWPLCIRIFQHVLCNNAIIKYFTGL